jgi:hypothetical protein
MTLLLKAWHTGKGNIPALSQTLDVPGPGQQYKKTNQVDKIIP